MGMKRGDNTIQLSNLLDKIGYFKSFYAVIYTICYIDAILRLKQLKPYYSLMVYILIGYCSYYISIVGYRDVLSNVKRTFGLAALMHHNLLHKGRQ